jgi:hypothetical protein
LGARHRRTDPLLTGVTVEGVRVDAFGHLRRGVPEQRRGVVGVEFESGQLRGGGVARVVPRHADALLQQRVEAD